MDPVIQIQQTDSVRIVRFNRPHVLNAIDRQMRRDLVAALTAANQEDSVRCVVLTEAGSRAFASGQDLDEARRFTAETASEWIEEFAAVYNALRFLDKPSIAAVNGYAVGSGFQIALLADIRIAADTAKVGMPEIKRCHSLHYGGLDLVGHHRSIPDSGSRAHGASA